ncbi:MAG TPA: hypothetical protein VG755_17230 [Nannocystaceae bacterium]|nr:hypothetical protein [Nannocystaceae bacterium]
MLLVLGLASACGGDDSQGSGESGALDGPIEFRGEQSFLPGFDFDSGWLPDGSPVTIRATATAGGGITVVAQASSDGSTITPMPGSGSLAVEGSLALELSAKIDTMGINYEGVVDSFEYGIDPVNEAFDPFTLQSDVAATSTLPAAVLGEVPIPSVPGATLVLEVTGGEITTAFAGSCAEAANGFAQFTGTLTSSGTVECAATVEIEIPFSDPLTFGPFAFDVAIPSLSTGLDLGTRSLATGEPAADMGICAIDPGTGSAAEADSSGDDGTDDAADDANDDAADTTGGEESTSDASGVSMSSTTSDPTGDTSGDPDYPPPGECPADGVPVQIGSNGDNGVCLPPCAGDGTCPSGQNGTAIGVCGFNPLSTFGACTTDGDCTSGETCIDGTCFYEPPTHCVLTCDGGAICPMDMDCFSGVCSYPS